MAQLCFPPCVAHIRNVLFHSVSWYARAVITTKALRNRNDLLENLDWPATELETWADILERISDPTSSSGMRLSEVTRARF